MTVPDLPALAWDAEGEWLAGATRRSSPNCDPRPADAAIDLVVIHGISLPPGEFGGEHIDALFANCLDENAHPYFAEIRSLQVSAHVLIRRDAQVVQYVPFSQRAWHAGESMFQGRAQCNDFSIGIELEGADETLYEVVQYRRLAELLGLIRKQWPAITRERIVGHCQVAPGRKTDPGPSFQWETLNALLDSGAVDPTSTEQIRKPPAQ